MAGGMDVGGGRDRKSLDAVINLVPFIDLMAVTIAFLIMTAVWTQVGRMQVASTGDGPATEAAAPPLALQLTAKDITLLVGSTPKPVTLATLTKELQPLNADSINIRPDDDVSYDRLVQAIDACLGARITGVTVTP
jgi:biopolymer transport protein TolR